MHGRCMRPRAVRKTGGMKGLVRLEGRISEAKDWWRYCRWAGGCVVEGTSKRILYLPPIPPYYTTQRFQSQTLHQHTTTPNLSTPLHQNPPSQPHIPPILSPSPSQKKSRTQHVLSAERTPNPQGLFYCTGGLSASLLQFWRYIDPSPTTRKRYPNPSKPKLSRYVDKLERHQYNFQEEAGKPQPRATNPRFPDQEVVRPQ